MSPLFLLNLVTMLNLPGCDIGLDPVEFSSELSVDEEEDESEFEPVQLRLLAPAW